MKESFGAVNIRPKFRMQHIFDCHNFDGQRVLSHSQEAEAVCMNFSM